MLGNHYFLSRNYLQAIDAYTNAFGYNYPQEVQKKIIICHIAQRNIKIAQHYFLKILRENPLIIINNKIKEEDCPCPELVESLEKNFNSSRSTDDIINLGMLWLFRDMDKSLKYFEEAQEIEPENKFLNDVIGHINKYILINKKG